MRNGALPDSPVWLSIGRASRLLGVNPATLRHWEAAGKLRAYRTPGGHRRFSTEEVAELARGTAPNGREAPRELAFTIIGLSYRSAPMALRERVAFAEAELPSALRLLAQQTSECLILSTCNRTELHVVTKGLAVGEGVLAEIRQVARAELGGHCYDLRDEAAVRHLLRVATGLDSMVLGETQILGQVRSAFETALRSGTVGRVLGRLVPLAVEIGKRAHTETRISRRALSPSSVAVELAHRCLGNLTPATALVVGAGDAGRATATSLQAAGVPRVLVANRSPERGRHLASSIGADSIPYTQLSRAIEEADIIIASTGASHHVLTEAMVREALAARHGRPLLCIDIAVPRDIDPAVADLPGVTLYNIDDLEDLCQENLRERTGEVAAVEQLVEEGMADYRAWRAVEPLVPTIGALYQRAEAIRRSELDRTLPRLRGLGGEERDLIDVMTASIVRRLLHGSVAALKARGHRPGAEQLAGLARELFGLPEAEPAS